MSERESPLKQQIGPKKYQQIVEKNAKFYDNYKAGKTDPKTGEFYHHISGNDPNKIKKLGGNSYGSIQCISCDNYFSITRATACIICNHCKKLNKITIDKETGEIFVSE